MRAARIREAVGLLRTLKADGFSVPLIVELALGPAGLVHDRPDEERALLLDLYRAESDGRPRPAEPPPFAFQPIDPEAPVFANFWRLYPFTPASAREPALSEWRHLSAEDRRAAIAAIDRDPSFIPSPPELYLAHRLWEETR